MGHSRNVLHHQSMRHVAPHLAMYGLRVSVDGADGEVAGIPAVGACLLHQLEPQLFVLGDDLVDLSCGSVNLIFDVHDGDQVVYPCEAASVHSKASAVTKLS